MPARFADLDDFLAVWREVLAERAAFAVDRVLGVPGVVGVVLGGSLGGGTPWPLSDVDILPVYEDEAAARAEGAVAQVRLEILDAWVTEGLRTPLGLPFAHK